MKNIEKISFKVIIGIIVFICIINFVVCPSMFNTNLYGLYDRWIGRKPHITGQIRLSIYGKTITLTEENAKLIYMNNNSEKNIVLVDGNFKKDYGNYGENIFRLQLSKSFCRQNINQSFKNDLIIEFGYFTAPNWYKDNTDLNIIIEKSKTNINSDTITIIQNVSGDDNGKTKESYNLKYPLNSQQILKVHQIFI